MLNIYSFALAVLFILKKNNIQFTRKFYYVIFPSIRNYWCKTNVNLLSKLINAWFTRKLYIFFPYSRNHWMMMIITPNSRAHRGKKERGEMKGNYGGVCEEIEGRKISTKELTKSRCVQVASEIIHISPFSQEMRTPKSESKCMQIGAWLARLFK